MDWRDRPTFPLRRITSCRYELSGSPTIRAENPSSQQLFERLPVLSVGYRNSAYNLSDVAAGQPHGLGDVLMGQPLESGHDVFLEVHPFPALLIFMSDLLATAVPT